MRQLGGYSALTKWSLPELLRSISSEVERTLADARTLIGHEGEKGGATEEVWRTLFRRHLPLRYQVDTGFVVDSEDCFSEQLDVIIFDRQYSPLVFEIGSRRIFPVESLYAAFEVKQVLNPENIKYARKKAHTVQNLKRTNLPVMDLHGEDVYRPLSKIIGGVLTLESDWSPPLGETFRKCLHDASTPGVLHLGCVANHGWFCWEERSSSFLVNEGISSTTGFLFQLVESLQRLGTVPMIDMSQYARHLP